MKSLRYEDADSCRCGERPSLLAVGQRVQLYCGRCAKQGLVIQTELLPMNLAVLAWNPKKSRGVDGRAAGV